MKESELIIMRKKIEQLGGLMQGVLQELNNLRDLSVGTLETVKRIPGYKKAIKELTKELNEKKDDNVE
jgi:fatty acid-binding protein DegV